MPMPRPDEAGSVRVLLHGAFEEIGSADEVGDEPRRRRLVDLARRPHLLDPSVLHDGDDVRDRERLFLVVRDVHGRDAERLLEPLELEAHLRAQLGVEVRERLVQQEQRRLHDEAAGEREPLLLAPG